MLESMNNTPQQTALVLTIDLFYCQAKDSRLHRTEMKETARRAERREKKLRVAERLIKESEQERMLNVKVEAVRGKRSIDRGNTKNGNKTEVSVRFSALPFYLFSAHRLQNETLYLDEMI